MNVLAVAESPELRRRLQALFPSPETQVHWERVISSVLKRFESHTYDVLVITGAVFKRDEAVGAALLEIIATDCSGTQVIFLVDSEDLSVAMSALRAGSYHYTRLPVSDEELQMLVETAVARRPKYAMNSLLRDSKRERQLDQLLGESPAMCAVYDEIRQAAAADIPVLLLGETGTGKELAAEAIHRSSARATGPYIPVHLSSLPPEFVAGELFGHERGAFTGAVERRAGVFEQGHRGTVFLDEIGTVDEKVQVSLLRLLEQKKFSRLGGRRMLSAHVRLIAATNEDLAAAAREGRFREDLYYRLDVFRIVMPPLRERHGDIPLLTRAFVQRYNETYQKQIIEIAPEFADILEAYAWPGNVRELKNVVQRAVLVCNESALTPEHLPPRFRQNAPALPNLVFPVGTPLDDVEREMVIGALTAVGNNRTRAAELLGISRRALYNKLRKHCIQ